jgi:hypothetical protein
MSSIQMTRLALVTTALALAFSSKNDVSADTATPVACTGQSTYCVRRETSSFACHVQRTTASPLGVDFLGPFNSRAAAVAAMCKNYDPQMMDSSKCWTSDNETCPNLIHRKDKPSDNKS